MYVANLYDWDVILGRPSLTKARALVDVASNTCSIQPPNKSRFQLTNWETRPRSQFITAATGVTECENSDPTDASDNDSEASSTLIDELTPEAFQIDCSATTLKPAFNPFEEFQDLFPEEKPTALPPLRDINHKINIIPGSTWSPGRGATYERFESNCMKRSTRNWKQEEQCMTPPRDPILSLCLPFPKWTTRKKQDSY